MDAPSTTIMWRVGREECENGWATKTRIDRVRPYWHDIRLFMKHLHEICSLYILSFRYLALNKTILESITSYYFVRFDDMLMSHFFENFVKIIRTSKQIVVNRLLTKISKL